MTSLPDVNVLLALVAAGHTHHAVAREWFVAREADSVGVCGVTQMGLLRLLTNPKVLPSGAHSIRRAWDVSNELLADKRVFFEYEPPELETAWTGMMNHPTTGPSSWTDAYIAAFAKRCDYEMVTFDRGFRRWSELTLTLLNQLAE
jgi:toxin-antitoxin system PIN domain toxin